MFRKEQKEQSDMPKELKAMIPFLSFLPKEQIENQFKKIWNKQTKCLDDPKDLKKVKKLQSKQTKKILYKEKPVFDYLEQILSNNETSETKEFVKWYKTEYYKISLKDLGIFK